jgi:hypothetical protein
MRAALAIMAFLGSAAIAIGNAQLIQRFRYCYRHRILRSNG